MKGLLVAVLACVAACSRPATVDYSSPSGRFSCRVPAAWHVQEDLGPRVTFYAPTVAMMLAYLKKDSEAGSASAYYAAQAASGAQVSPLAAASWKGRAAFAFSARRRGPARHGPALELLEKTELIPLDDGLLVVSASGAPERGSETSRLLSTLLETVSVR